MQEKRDKIHDPHAGSTTAGPGRKYWSRLSLAFHIAFWVTAVFWFLIAGEAGSPLPDNWRELLAWLHVMQFSGLIVLVGSVMCGVLAFRRESRVSVAAIVSLALLMLISKLLLDSLRDDTYNNF